MRISSNINSFCNKAIELSQKGKFSAERKSFILYGVHPKGAILIHEVIISTCKAKIGQGI